MSAGMWTAGPVATLPERSARAGAATVPAAGTRPARIALGAAVLAVACMGYLHLVPSGVDPVAQPLSSYVGFAGGWPFTVGVLAAAAACLALARAAYGVRGGAPARAALGIAALAFTTAAMFPTDVGYGPLSTSAEIHRWAAAVGMGAVPAAALAVTLGLRRRGDAPGLVRRLWHLLAVTAVLLTLTGAGTMLPSFMHGGEWRGVPQRALLLLEIVQLMVLAFLSLRAARLRAAPHRDVHGARPPVAAEAR